MSQIDLYKHQLLGFIKCESDYDIVYGNSTRKIAVYKLLENIPDDERDFDGRINDILVGGGSGEAPAFRISNPNAFKFFNEDDVDCFTEYDELFKSFLSPNQSFEMCNGFLKSGWSPKVDVQFWLAEQVCNLLIKYVSEFSKYTMQELPEGLEFIVQGNETE